MILADFSHDPKYRAWLDKVHSLIKPSNDRYWENYNMDFICKVHAFPYWQFHIKRFNEQINKPYTEAGLRELIEYRDSHYPGLKMQKRGRPRKLN